MASLESLPIELQLYIFSEDLSPRDLHDIAKTSKYFHDLLQHFRGSIWKSFLQRDFMLEDEFVNALSVDDRKREYFKRMREHDELLAMFIGGFDFVIRGGPPYRPRDLDFLEQEKVKILRDSAFIPRLIRLAHRFPTASLPQLFPQLLPRARSLRRNLDVLIPYAYLLNIREYMNCFDGFGREIWKNKTNDDIIMKVPLLKLIALPHIYEEGPFILIPHAVTSELELRLRTYRNENDNNATSYPPDYLSDVVDAINSAPIGYEEETDEEM